MSHETANVIVSRTGTGWTVDVTAANLSTTTSIKDFIIFHNGALADVANYTKTTPTILTYTGTALGTGTTVEVRRFTDDGQISPVGYSDRLSSADYNSELDRLHRIIAESRLNGIGGVSGFTPTLSNAAYGVSWASDTLNGSTRQAIYNKFESISATNNLKAPLDSPIFTGVPNTTPPAGGDSSTRIPTTGWVQNEFVSKYTNNTITASHTFQNGASFTGVSPTVPTPATGDSSTKAASTAFVQGEKVSPAFTGTPTAPTAAVDTNTTQLATTAFFVGQAGSSAPLMNGTVAVGTSLRFSRQDHIHPTDTSRAAASHTHPQSDIINLVSDLALKAPLTSPNFGGVPTVPTAALDTNTTQAASTQYVLSQGSNTNPLMNGSASFGTSLRWSRSDHVHPTDTSRAPLASPIFTGTPAAPTPLADNNSTAIATTAYYVGQRGTVQPLMNGTSQIGTSTRWAPIDHRHPTDTSLAPLTSPNLGGVPTTPTAALDTNNTQIASTAFVLNQGNNTTPLRGTSAGAVGTSLRWSRADHVHPNYENFIAVANVGSFTTVANTGWNLNEVSDPSGAYNPANGRYTAPVAGWYLVMVHMSISVQTPIRLVVNGSTQSLTHTMPAGYSSTQWLVNLVANDFINIVDTVGGRTVIVDEYIVMKVA